MVGDFVALEVPRDTPVEYAEAAVASCVAALGDGRCSLDTPLRENETEPRWSAQIRWVGAGSTELLVELRGGPRSATLAERHVSFSSSDAPRQRWASAGLVVASLVADREREPEHESVPARPEPPDPIPVPARAPPPWTPRPVPRFDAGALAGPALEPTRFRAGGFARAGLALAPLPLAAQASVRLAASPGQPEMTTLSGAAGVTVRIGPWGGPLSLELRGEGVAERVLLVATDPVSSERERATRARLGGGLGLDADWALTRPVHLLLGADVTLLRPEVVVDVLGEPRGREAPVSWFISAGCRVVPWR